MRNKHRLKLSLEKNLRKTESFGLKTMSTNSALYCKANSWFALPFALCSSLCVCAHVETHSTYQVPRIGLPPFYLQYGKKVSKCRTHFHIYINSSAHFCRTDLTCILLERSLHDVNYIFTYNSLRILAFFSLLYKNII